MSRRSRHNAGTPLTLFSFQDIMTTIMGILVLVTLLMALDLLRGVAGLAEARREPAATAPAEELARLRQREGELQAEYRRQLAGVVQLAELGGDQRERVRQLLARLEETQRQVRAAEAEVARRREPGPDPAVADRADAADETVRLEQRTARLKAEAAELRANPRLTYIVQPGTDKQPVLLEVSGRRIGLGVPDPTGSALWFDAPDAAARLKLLEQVTGQYDAARQYFVILVKPSGFGAYHDLAAVLRRQGFDVGTELIDEGHTVLPRPPGRP